jgi:tetratricopeptide (TPR) repeat protein
MLAQATRESSHDPEALNLLAYAQAEQNKLDQALATAEAALKAARGSANIIDTVGEMHERRREFTKAESYYADALSRMSPFESCETHTKLARTLIALHRPAAAIPHLNMALRYPQQPWADLAAHLLRSIAPGREVPAPVAPFSRGIAPR